MPLRNKTIGVTATILAANGIEKMSCRSQVTVQSFVDSLKRPEFLAELHKLLWIDPHDNHGQWDPGWSCRDHAVLLCALASLYRLEPTIISGKCIYGMRRTGYPNFIATGQDVTQPGGHSWIELPEVGMIDLSPNIAALTNVWGSEVRTFKGIFGNMPEPQGSARLVVCSTLAEYDREIAASPFSEGVLTAIYVLQAAAPFELALLEDPFTRVNSPLTCFLSALFPKSIYAKAVLHLRDRLEGRGRSVAGVSRRKAWQIVNEKEF